MEQVESTCTHTSIVSDERALLRNRMESGCNFVMKVSTGY